MTLIIHMITCRFTNLQTISAEDTKGRKQLLKNSVTNHSWSLDFPHFLHTQYLITNNIKDRIKYHYYFIEYMCQ